MPGTAGLAFDTGERSSPNLPPSRQRGPVEARAFRPLIIASKNGAFAPAEPAVISGTGLHSSVLPIDFFVVTIPQQKNPDFIDNNAGKPTVGPTGDSTNEQDRCGCHISVSHCFDGIRPTNGESKNLHLKLSSPRTNGALDWVQILPGTPRNKIRVIGSNSSKARFRGRSRRRRR